MIRVQLPHHLRTLAYVDREVELDIEGPVTIQAIIDAVESRYPMLAGTIRDHVSGSRRPYLRYFTCGRDVSHEEPTFRLPDEVAAGKEPLIILGAISGG